MNILVIDVGTSSMRGILYNEKAEKLFTHQICYNVIFTDKIYAEQNPEVWKLAMTEIISRNNDYADSHNLEITALSLTAQRSSVIPVDSNGKPMQNAIMWMDIRNRQICRNLEQYRNIISSKTGAGINPVFAGSKITWIHQNQPDIYKRAYKILTIADFLAYTITHEFRTDKTYGSRTSLMNIRTGAWDKELLDIFNVDEDKLCELINPGEILGTVCKDYAELTGLKEGIPLISAGGDQQCAALGQGLFEEGAVELTTGTGAFALAFTDRVPKILGTDVICGAHAVKNTYILETSMLACSSLYNWYKNNFYSPDTTFDDVNREIEQAPAGANGCIALPFFQGRGTPDWNDDAEGMFYGLKLQTTKADMARALLEAVALEAENNILVLQKYVSDIKKIYIGGGLTNFKAFNQIQSDIYQKELIRYSSGEETSLGAYLNAAVGMGIYSDHRSAFKEARKFDTYEVYTPDPGYKALYENKLKKMNTLYECVYAVRNLL